ASAAATATTSASDDGSADTAELPLEVAQIRRRVDAAPRHALQEVLRHEGAAVPVHVLAKPLAERRELAALELLVEVAEVGLDALPELNGDDVAEGVRGEVAEAHVGPVDVLEDAAGEIGRIEPEVVA